MKKYEILKKIKENVLVAVVRAKDEIDAEKICDMIVEGGIKTLEITFTTPYAEKAIEIMSKKRKDILVGAGTVMDDITARIAILNGAQFIVSPHLDENISKLCNRYSIPYLPGCGTVTEVKKALESGCDVVKLFPGGLLKSSFIKDIKGPMPYVNAMPSGGVSLDNMDEWLKVGSFAIGIGSALTKDVKESGYESVKENTLKFVKKLEGILGE